jgi:hypothetical protein
LANRNYAHVVLAVRQLDGQPTGLTQLA